MEDSFVSFFSPLLKIKMPVSLSLSLRILRLPVILYIEVRLRGFSPVHLDMSVGDVLVQFMFRQSRM